MFPSTIALLDFMKHHFERERDCKMLTRIECAVRGEEIYLSFSHAPECVQSLMKAVFDFHASCHLSRDGTVPIVVMMAYLQATTTVYEMKNEICMNGLVAFGQFVEKYFDALKRMNSVYYFQLPERSTDTNTNHVCDIFELCQYDVLPDYISNGWQTSSFDLQKKLPSWNVRLPDTLPWYMCAPQVLHRVALGLYSIRA